MSNFWANRLGASQQPSAPAPAPRTDGPWWLPAQPQAAPQPPAQPVQQAPQTPTQHLQQQVSMGDLLQQDAYTTTKAQSARDGEPCPDCGSVNYIAPVGHANAMKQCFECGYNPRFQHSTHGASGIGQAGLPQYTARAQTQAPPGAAPMGSVIAHI